MKKILHISAEAVPFASSGGLGDVLGSLPKEIASLNKDEYDIRVVIPLYKSIDKKFLKIMKNIKSYKVRLAWRNQDCSIKSLKKDGITYYFIQNEMYFDRDNIYGYYDDVERFAFLSKASLSLIDNNIFKPDIIHAHDWHGAMSIIFYNAFYKVQTKYSKIKTILTIHNIEFQGKCDYYAFKDLFDIDDNLFGTLEYNGSLNVLKGGIELADFVTTVSESYSEELKKDKYAFGLSDVLIAKENFCGILNGIDDKKLNIDISQKGLYKQKLQEEFSLIKTDKIPIFAIISRLTYQKGFDLFENFIFDFVKNNKIELIVLGMGEKNIENIFLKLQTKYPKRVKTIIAFDRELADKIYLGSDFFIMPSKFEPCGLSQMIASKNGSIPIVHSVGGLKDSIKPFVIKNSKIIKGNGFSFKKYSSKELKNELENALLYFNTDLFLKMRNKVYKSDFSWNKSAKAYDKLYNEIVLTK